MLPLPMYRSRCWRLLLAGQGWPSHVAGVAGTVTSSSLPMVADLVARHPCRPPAGGRLRRERRGPAVPRCHVPRGPLLQPGRPPAVPQRDVQAAAGRLLKRLLTRQRCPCRHGSRPALRTGSWLLFTHWAEVHAPQVSGRHWRPRVSACLTCVRLCMICRRLLSLNQSSERSGHIAKSPALTRSLICTCIP